MHPRHLVPALVLALFAAAAPARAAEPFPFGLLLVGPHNDRGWSQAHYEAGRHLEQTTPGLKMVYIDKVNPADRPGITVPQLVDELVEQGCRLIVANSDDMKDGILEAAALHPQVYFVHVSGDHALAGTAPPNLSNLMGRMEYGKAMAGFVAALTTRTGKIGYLGPLINEETRRLAAACYLGARHAWVHVLGKPAEALRFKVTWIGFWFHIPGVTADPTQVSQSFFDSGYDVVVSGIDTTEALVVARQKRAEGKTVWAVPYDYAGACEGGGESCLGVPYFNWVPGYRTLIDQARSGRWTSQWLWLGPDWTDLGNVETSSVGFAPGPALSPENRSRLQAFVRDLGSGKVKLFQGPLRWQDGTEFLKPGQVADDKTVWYLPQLLEGMEGPSSAK
ncbi:MAG: BMP family ABC transporter substrate-binding protein [Deferrisomatales bacterium]